MKGLFGFGSKLSNKLLATKFTFTFTIHNLSPWPQGHRAIAVGWQRGKKKRGATRSVYPSTAPGRIGSVVRFNEKFELSASLYKASTGSSVAANLGPFKKKCMILAVLETDGKTQATAALGRVVIDLAEFAGIEQQETRTFQVSCNKSVHSAVGDPQLTVTIRCRWKNSSTSAGAGQEAVMDDMGSISTDTTGSRMTANLSSFLRFKFNKGGMAGGNGSQTAVNEEQDLGGFAEAVSHTSLRMSTRDVDKNAMGTIQEGADEESSPARVRSGASGGSRTAYLPHEHQDQVSSSGTPPGGGTQNGGPYRASAGNSNGNSSAVGGMSLREMYSGATVVAPRSSKMLDEEIQAANGAVRQDIILARGSETPSRVTSVKSGSDMTELNSGGGPTTYTELLTVAATEVCAYLGRISATRKPERNCHAPARRTARTMLCLGQHQGTAFGRQVVGVIEAQVTALPSSDLQGLVFWWENAVHLRVLLQTISSNGLSTSSGTLPSTRWAVDALAPELARLERTVIFERILRTVWEETLIIHASSSNLVSPSASSNAPITKRALQEAAIKHWLSALEGLSKRLGALGSKGHVQLLRQQVLHQCLKRLDALFFYHLLTPSVEGEEVQSDLLLDYDPSNTLWGRSGTPVPFVDEACLPFSRGLLTFGSGMGVKMTVTRLQQWASGQGLNDMSPIGAATPQFPLLRTTADLLMMPKELLLESAIRRDVAQALSMKSMVQILKDFKTDEYAHDSIDPAVLAVMEDELAVAPSTWPPLSDLSFRPHADETGLLRGAFESEPGIEYDAESESELDELGALVGGSQGVPSRMRMLHQLWSLGVPRRKSS
ncbi:hypothetical protein CEUSTIGMA_g7296.t1 [Chlamydomonas eustigma]|uniref:C2 NT-type domain-containing protein n=1 Tax=Chlamydomonas eustigma TaxID=1157962 RepID=A0A250X9Y5_9CHLO|nr:hypothetical protein CEUSTIGMA_g7296.t1 [Chlamydomonas eustigma]|eukprot:GAX79856.1 hypothetical protein CEUSTIGMA_g7296.t1 [Chlamydomonas eustigma]